MALTWGNIKQWAPDTLDTAEIELRKARRSMVGLADELETMGLPARWDGDASQTSQGKLKNVTRDLKDLVAEVSTAYTAVCDAADGVRGVELAVDAAAEFATTHQLSISADGTVTDTGPSIDTGNDHDNGVALDERQGWVTECVDLIEQALRKASDVDTDLAGVLERIELNRIHVGPGGLATASKLGEVEGDLSLLEPPEGATPSDSAAWWATLSPDERRQIIARHPEWIGNRDGVDFTSRDLANRIILDSRRAWVEGRLDDPDLTPAQRKDLEEEQASIAQIDEMLDRQGVHQLAGLDFSKERTEAIVVNGNLDSADQVAVFTPGMTSNVPGMGGYDTDMAQLKRRMEAILLAEGDVNADGSPKTVATVTWMGYQAPQALPDTSVASRDAAETGGASLADFYRGINTSRMGDPDITALGHSYGSTTTGIALQESNTGVDRTVLFGSPGAATMDIDDYETKSGTTYYAETKNDLVGDVGRFGGDLTHLDGVKHLETDADTTPDGRPLARSSGHSEYLDDGTTSQHSMAAVASGHPEQAIEGHDPSRQDLWGQVKTDGYEVAVEARDRTVEFAGDVKDGAVQTYERGRDFAVDTYEDGRKVAVDTYNTGRDAIVETYEDGREVVVDTYEDGRDAAVETYEDGKDLADDIGDGTREVVGEGYKKLTGLFP